MILFKGIMKQNTKKENPKTSKFSVKCNSFSILFLLFCWLAKFVTVFSSFLVLLLLLLLFFALSNSSNNNANSGNDNNFSTVLMREVRERGRRRGRVRGPGSNNIYSFSGQKHSGPKVGYTAAEKWHYTCTIN